ncbi:hypothetical protein TIFTF001_037386 [Ficus carica]|uniref:Nodulation signaling pathway 2-like protein n=1 Tax=Ficus carica TaxID=3494 RepID=A0AA88JBS5_FICCA|nr:hypothetical protein TIFTF001_037386 [Ficus carica]
MTDLLMMGSAMAIAMEMMVDDPLDLDLSDYSTTTTTTNTIDQDDRGCKWNEWSPVVDWTALTGGHDDFHDLIESMMDEDDNDDGGDILSNSYSTQTSTGTAVSGDVDVAAGEVSDDSNKGVRLVHLLMAAAEAVGGENKSRDLARVILVRLKELVSPTKGTNIERLAAHFSEALHSLLECAAAGGPHSKHHHHHFFNGDNNHHHHHQNDVVAAFQFLQDMSPYVKFGHFTANQAILEAAAHDRRIHIVDYDIMEGIQWASLMQALVSRKDGPPSPHLRITALSRGASSSSSSAAARRSIGTVQETSRRLAAFAASIGLPFSFHQCRLDSDESFRPSAVKLVKGEALIVNCMLNLPHFSYRSQESVESFLSGAKTLKPRLITLVEEEAPPPPPTPTDGGQFVARFMDLLYQYSAVYDSLEAGFPMQGRGRALVERVFLGPRIVGSLGRIYRARRDERGSWGEWLAVAGCSAVPVSFANICQAKLLMGLFNDGYRVEELASNRLVLGWKSRRLLSASLWTSSFSDSDHL